MCWINPAVSRAHPSPAQAPKTLVTLQAGGPTLTHRSSTRSPRSASVLGIPGCYPFLPHLRSHLVQVYYLRYVGRQRPGHTAALVTASLGSKQARNTPAPSDPSPAPRRGGQDRRLSAGHTQPRTLPSPAQPSQACSAGKRSPGHRKETQAGWSHEKKTFAFVFIKICQKEVEFSALNTSFWIVCLGKEAQGKRSRAHAAGSPTQTLAAKGSVPQNTTRFGNRPLCLAELLTRFGSSSSCAKKPRLWTLGS